MRKWHPYISKKQENLYLTPKMTLYWIVGRFEKENNTKSKHLRFKVKLVTKCFPKEKMLTITIFFFSIVKYTTIGVMFALVCTFQS